MKTKVQMILSLALGLFLVACAHCDYSKKAGATAKLEAKNDSKVAGEIKLYESKEGKVMAKIHISGLTANAKHGFHIHENGDCSAKDGTSAGGHYAPEGHKHAGPGAKMRHLGDLGNITADAKGEVKTEIEIPRATLKKSEKLTIYNKAFIVHAGTDDLKSQPSGAAGKRIACGVIQ